MCGPEDRNPCPWRVRLLALPQSRSPNRRKGLRPPIPRTLHDELRVTPCSPRCAVWLLYGVEPVGVSSRTHPGHCKGRAHRRTTLGLPGQRVLVSRKWSGKTLADHRADRKAFVLESLAAVGITKEEPDRSRMVWQKVQPDDPSLPPRDHLLMHAIAERIKWRAEYDRALLAAAGPPSADISATQLRAA